MHTSFEDLRPYVPTIDDRVKLYQDQQNILYHVPPGGEPGDVLMTDKNGEWMWHRPRSHREAGYRRSLILTLAIGIGLGVPLAVALVFVLT